MKDIWKNEILGALIDLIVCVHTHTFQVHMYGANAYLYIQYYVFPCGARSMKGVCLYICWCVYMWSIVCNVYSVCVCVLWKGLCGVNMWGAGCICLHTWYSMWACGMCAYGYVVPLCKCMYTIICVLWRYIISICGRAWMTFIECVVYCTVHVCAHFQVCNT